MCMQDTTEEFGCASGMMTLGTFSHAGTFILKGNRTGKSEAGMNWILVRAFIVSMAFTAFGDEAQTCDDFNHFDFFG